VHGRGAHIHRNRSYRENQSRQRQRRTIVLALSAALAALTLVVSSQHVALAYPPTPPSATGASSMLAALTVATPRSCDGYDRALFPHLDYPERHL
jgi:hypothetical protein